LHLTPRLATKTIQLFSHTKNRKDGCAGLEIPVAENIREAEDEASEPGQHATCQFCPESEVTNGCLHSRYASIAGRRTPPGHQCLLESIFAWTVLRITDIWVYISRLCDPRILTVCCPTILFEEYVSDLDGRVAMGSVADYESGWQRVCHEVLPVKWRNRSFEQQRPNDKIYVECSHKVQRGAEAKIYERCHRVRH
jgi:hypothetical protein